ncbi:hypothetical protein [Hoyosella altamirensis]|uniref:hypothetical protein n=1 Tax=Hoyosella altamirensis TaxID=616997 RepID=UPI0007DAFFD4|nr:hypothetical protein [Hoyosella altamirensis]
MTEPLTDDELRLMIDDPKDHHSELLFTSRSRRARMARELLELRKLCAEREEKLEFMKERLDASGKKARVKIEKLGKFNMECHAKIVDLEEIVTNGKWLLAEVRWKFQDHIDSQSRVIRKQEDELTEDRTRIAQLARERDEAREPFGTPTIEPEGYGWRVIFESGAHHFDGDDSNEHDLEMTWRRGIAAKAILDHLAAEKAATPSLKEDVDYLVRLTGLLPCEAGDRLSVAFRRVKAALAAGRFDDLDGGAA